MEPRRVLARLSGLLFGISRLLRAPVDVAHDVDGKPMLYEWSLHRQLAPQLDHTGGWGSGRQLDQSTSQVSGSQVDQSSGPAGIKAPNSTLGTLIVLSVGTSSPSCSLDRQCFTSIVDVAEFLSTWQSSQALHQMGIPVYSARADTRAGRPSSGTAPTRVLVLLSLAVFGTAVSCVLAIQVVRKRKIVHVARTWFPPAATHHDTCKIC
ncbi:unnamed protein product [Anisakis simplex]|uniref:NOD domain-containing protein n=1 Tax=Anisakis simplex TaxID=6269 RepID=A0A0M3J8Y6_ANISI|nr:unnamed protein product [Anisakis simplex]